jgi:hypothetical protein
MFEKRETFYCKAKGDLRKGGFKELKQVIKRLRVCLGVI